MTFIHGRGYKLLAPDKEVIKSVTQKICDAAKGNSEICRIRLAEVMPILLQHGR